MKQLATLFLTKLNPGLTVYVEYSNEVWNTAFEPANYNLAQAKAEVAANPKSDLKYDGSTNPTTWADRRFARRLKQIGDIFKSVWTGAGLANPIYTRVRPILCSQGSSLSRFDNMLKYINTVYGPPKNYFYGIGESKAARFGQEFVEEINRRIPDP